MSAGYFHRVAKDTPTRFWINNPSEAEVHLSVAAGAISCTTNPTYGSKLIKSEPDYIHGVIDRALADFLDDESAAERVCHEITARLANWFLPLYEQSNGTLGFVTLQSDPRKDEDATELIRAALDFRSIGPNFMTKIPVTSAGLLAMEFLIGEGVSVCATEVFAIDQVVAICELYEKTAKRTGKHPPLFVTHIAGIFDEYLGTVIQRDSMDISPNALRWAGCSVGRKEYHLIKQRGYPGTMLGGGARSTYHFSDFVGGDVHITINWSTADELISADKSVISEIESETPAGILEELLTKLPEFAVAHTEGSMQIADFEEYGPVRFFRDNFIAGYEHLVAEVASRRLMLKDSSVTAAR